jgi:type VII secretion-associated serine protease mycosin
VVVVVVAVAIALVGSVVVAVPGGAAGDGTDGPAALAEIDDLWAIAETDAGGVEVVRGDEALDAVADDEVVTAEPDQVVRSLGTNDPLRPGQWALDKTSFEPAWAATRGGGVKVAVIDSGVRGNHEDLAGAVLPGIDYIDGGDGRIDPAGHGTAVAGVIAAQINNGRGIAGAAPDVRILPIRVLDANGSGNASNVAAGVIWAVDHGARVINLSLGGGPSAGIQAAMQYARSKNVVVVAAAGNNYENGNLAVYPGAYPEAIAVAAVGSDLQRANFSNTGSYVDISAPGKGVTVLWGTGPTTYAGADGTSFAAPYVAAAAALLIAQNPGLSAASVTSLLETTTDDLGAPGADTWYGHGLVHPQRALITGLLRPPGWNTKGKGYWTVTAAGHVHPYGGAGFYGDLTGVPLVAPIVASAVTPSGGGYWLTSADGGVFAFGDARFYGSMGGTRLNQPIVGMAASPSGRGYLMLARDGGVFAFGDARFYGSTGGWRLNAPVLDLAMTADGRGYWFVAADGGVFSFGNARFRGSTGGMALAAPVRSMGAAADGRGYWMVADDGGIFAFNVPFAGSLPQLRSLLGLPYVSSIRFRALPSGDGYYILGLDGTVSSFGTAKNFGSPRGVWAVDLMLVP